MPNFFRMLWRELFPPKRRRQQPDTLPDTRAHWLDPGHPRNPYPFRLLDISTFATTMLSVTENPAVAHTYNSLRHDDGRRFIDQLPRNSASIACDLRYPLGAPLPPDGPVYRSHKMEEKWDLSLFNNRIYINRSWLGDLVYVAEFQLTDNLLHIHTLHAGDATSPNSHHLETMKFAFLLATLMFRKQLPAPLPSPSIESPDLLATLLFGLYGSQALFAADEHDIAPYLLPASPAP